MRFVDISQYRQIELFADNGKSFQSLLKTRPAEAGCAASISLVKTGFKNKAESKFLCYLQQLLGN